jgi:hypothetical protein
MTAEGWNGKSIRHHVESAASVAAGAMDAAEEAATEASKALGATASLREEIAELVKAVNAAYAEGGSNEADEGAAAMKRATLFQKVAFIRQEIAAWHHFMTEAQGVRGALQEWRRLDLGLKGSRE